MSTGSAPSDSSGAAGQAANQAQEKAQELAGQAQQHAQQVAGQASDRLRQELDRRSTQAGEQISTQASDLRAVSDSLLEQGKTGPATAASRLADHAERVGDYLRDRDSNALLADAEDFGRRQPWAVAAGGLALGFAASRFLKASSSRRYATRSGSDRRAPGVAGASYSRPRSSPSSDGYAGESVPPVPPPAASVPPLAPDAPAVAAPDPHLTQPTPPSTSGF